ncbi:hypothetical protein JTB14_023086 [Gonioctena quinquepunctata]|nr:hypothetical protein JTB14_023086 [Gonioctena quinquepunctata]
MNNRSLYSNPIRNTLCGEDGFNIWSPQRHDLAYNFGKQEGFVARGRCQKRVITTRSVISLILGFLPSLQLFIEVFDSERTFAMISVFLAAVQAITWYTHAFYNRGLRKRLGKSPRGPMSMCVVWSIIFALTVISTRSNYLVYKYSFQNNFSIYVTYGFNIAYMILQLGYAVTLVPGEGDTEYLNFAERYVEIEENQPLINNAYVRFLEEGDPTYLGVAMEQTHWLSRLLFSWVNPLMSKGVEGHLTSADDLYDLPLSLNCGYINVNINKHFENDDVSSGETGVPSPEESAANIPRSRSLFRALHKHFCVQFYSVGILKFIADCSGFAGPMLLNKLVGFIEDKREDIAWGYAYAAGLVLTTTISALCDSHFNFWMAMIGLKMRGAIVTMIYQKTLSVSSTILTSKLSVGEIVNFMSTDTDRIVNFSVFFGSIPFQLGVTLYLLYTQVGLAFLAGLVFSIILIPINKVIANKIGQLSTKLMEYKDARVKIIAEVLRGIKAIKLYVWEQHFIGLITKVRDQELKYLKGRKYLDALCVYFWATTPVIISILTFATYVLMGNKLTAATVFTSMALLNMLISPLNAFPWVLNGMTEAWVSVKRIQKLLDLENLDLEKYYQVIDGNDLKDNIEIAVSEGDFHWCKNLTSTEKKRLHANTEKKSLKQKGKGKKSGSTRDKGLLDRPSTAGNDDSVFSLHDINFEIKKGEFVGIVGPVGGGKSTFLAAVLGELDKQSGNITVSHIDSGFGFVTQQPWLQRGTVRDNILFGRPFDEIKYKSVIFACGLIDDIVMLPSGDMTGVGESGTTLSGGQKARIALARAVYQDKPAYLLDDILSAVDVNVAKHIFHHCIMGLLRDKTRVLCTHHLRYLMYADRIGLLENGSFKMIGKPIDVLGKIDDNLPTELELEESLQPSSVSSSIFLDSIKSENQMDTDDKDSILLEETSETGSLELGVYSSYWKGIGHIISSLILISIILMQLSRNMTDW